MPAADKGDSAVALLQVEEPRVYAQPIGWQDVNARPKTMQEFCQTHYGCSEEAQAEGKKDSRAARQETRAVQRKLRAVKRRAARSIRRMKRRQAHDFQESLKYGIKAKTEKLERENRALKKASSQWSDEKLMCDTKILQFKQMQEKVKNLSELQAALEKKSVSLENEEAKVNNLESQVQELQGATIDRKLAKKLGHSAEKNKFLLDALEKWAEQKSDEGKLKAAITGAARTRSEQKAKLDIQKSMKVKHKHLVMKEKGVKLSMRVDQKKRALKAEEAQVLDPIEANVKLEKAEEAKLSELRVKAMVKGGNSASSEALAKAQLRRVMAQRETDREHDEKKAKVTGRVLVEKAKEVKETPEAKLEQEREKEVSEASEKRQVKEGNAQERRSKKDLRANLKTKEKNMAVEVGVEEMQKTDDLRKQDIKATDRKSVV